MASQSNTNRVRARRIATGRAADLEVLDSAGGGRRAPKLRCAKVNSRAPSGRRESAVSGDQGVTDSRRPRRPRDQEVILRTVRQNSYSMAVAGHGAIATHAFEASLSRSKLAERP